MPMYKHEDASYYGISIFPVGGVVIWEHFDGFNVVV